MPNILKKKKEEKIKKKRKKTHIVLDGLDSIVWWENLRSCSRTVPPMVSKIIIFMCVLIKCLSSIVKCV